MSRLGEVNPVAAQREMENLVASPAWQYLCWLVDEQTAHRYKQLATLSMTATNKDDMVLGNARTAGFIAGMNYVILNAPTEVVQTFKKMVDEASKKKAGK